MCSCLMHAFCSVKVHLIEWLRDSEGVPYLGKRICVNGTKLRPSEHVRFDDADEGDEDWRHLLKIVDAYDEKTHSDYPLKSTKTYLPLEQLGGNIHKVVDAITPGCLDEVERTVAAHMPSRSNSVGSDGSEGGEGSEAASPPTGRMQRHICSPQKKDESRAQYEAKYKVKLDLARCATPRG